MMNFENYDTRKPKEHEPIKKCGHPKGYKCGCNVHEPIEDRVFDLVDEINLRHGKKR